MHFAHPWSWWLFGLIGAAAALLGILGYRRPLAPLTGGQRGLLVALRTLAFIGLALVLLRPVTWQPPANEGELVLPVLVDASRSMRLEDADGQARITRAVTLLRSQLVPALAGRFKPVFYGVGESLVPQPLDRLTAEAPHTDLVGALLAIRDRSRGERLPAVVLVSDGGDTTSRVLTSTELAGLPPVFAIGVGSTTAPRDREVVGVTAGDPRLDQASVDLHVTAISSGFGRTPFQLRLLANGRSIDERRIVPPSDGTPIETVFTVLPDPAAPTVYTAQIPPDEAEAVPENNARSVLVSPSGRKRRLLMFEGAPGFEHSFIKRAWGQDPDLEVDSVVKKGRNIEGVDTFVVQAAPSRVATLTGGFPSSREELYGYDAVVLANVDGDLFSRDQLAMIADFVGERGGGLLILGNRSFAQHGLVATPLEEVLPVTLDVRGAAFRPSLAAGEPTPPGKLTLTTEGETHPVMRLGGSIEETRKSWAALPELAAVAPLGGPRPGASVLAVTAEPGGALAPVVAVQRYGHGRSMVFAGEASWRWKMLMPLTDRSHEFFWRQAARWLAGPAPDPVDLSMVESVEVGDSLAIDVLVRDPAFQPVPAATVAATVTDPHGAVRPIAAYPVDNGAGRYRAVFHPTDLGLYRIAVEAHKEGAARGGAVRGAETAVSNGSLGTAVGWLSVGPALREFADPRLNEAFLRRVAEGSGGRYLRAADAKQMVAWLESAVPRVTPPERHDVWDVPWVFGLVVGLLSVEWILRRRWGLR